MLSRNKREGKGSNMKAVRHVGIVVKDLKGALRFYNDILGLKIQRKTLEEGKYIDKVMALKGVKVRTIKMSADDGNLIELLCFESHPVKVLKRGISDPGFSHVAFTVEDIDCEYKRLKGRRVWFNSLPQTSPDGRAKVLFCRDPEGNIIELVEDKI